MTRQGYDSEYRAKLELIKKYGKENVIKVAIAQQGSDFIIVDKDRIILQIEVKETIANKYYPDSQSKSQINRVTEFGKSHKIRSELWIYYKKGVGHKTEKEVRVLYEPQQK